MALSSKFQGIALSVIAKLVNGAELGAATTMTVTINGKSQTFTVAPSKSDEAPETTEADKAVLARLDSYFARKGTTRLVAGKPERNTIDLDMVCELCSCEPDAVRSAVRSASSAYRFFRGESIGVEVMPGASETSAPVTSGVVKSSANAPKGRKVA